MSYREIPFTKNREVVGDLMLRARRFHASLSVTCEFDVTDLLARVERERARGREVGMAAFMTAATSKLLEQEPRLNRHLFTDVFGRRREIEFDEITCTLVVQRKALSGEEILLPLNLRRSNTMSVEEIHGRIRRAKQQDLMNSKEFEGMQRVKRMPRLALKYFSFKARSDPDFYLKYFGTYGLSSVMAHGGSAFAMSAFANTAAAFFPGTMKERPVVLAGQIVPRTIMNVGFVFDHYLIDGLDMARACEALRAFVEDPSTVLGPETITPSAGAPRTSAESSAG